MVVRKGEGGHFFVTDRGHWIVDAHLGRIANAPKLAGSLASIPGVVEHGLFIGLASMAMLAGVSGNSRYRAAITPQSRRNRNEEPVKNLVGRRPCAGAGAGRRSGRGATARGAAAGPAQAGVAGRDRGGERTAEPERVSKIYAGAVPNIVQRAKDQMLQNNLNYQKDLNEVAVIIAQKLAGREKEIGEQMAKIYANDFTEQELKDLVTFYKTPLGQKLLVQEPKPVQASMTYMSSGRRTSAERSWMNSVRK